MATMTADLSKYDLTSACGLKDAISYLLDLKKGKNIVAIDLAGKTIVADYFVIASAYSTTAVWRTSSRSAESSPFTATLTRNGLRSTTAS